MTAQTTGALAAIPIDDRGFTLGHGLFETVLAEGGRLVFFEEHAARLRGGCHQIGLPAPEVARLQAAAEAPWPKPDWRPAVLPCG